MTKLIIRTVTFGLIMAASIAVAQAKTPDLDTVEIRADLVQAHAKTEKPMFTSTRTFTVERKVQYTRFCVQFIPTSKKTQKDDKCTPVTQVKTISKTEIKLSPAGSGGSVEISKETISFIRNLNREAALKNAWARVATHQQLALMKSAVDLVIGKTLQPTVIATVNLEEL